MSNCSDLGVLIRVVNAGEAGAHVDGPGCNGESCPDLSVCGGRHTAADFAERSMKGEA